MKHLAVLLLGTALASTPALAQQTNPNMNAQPSAAGSNATTAQQRAGMANANYLTQNDANLWRASQLSGVEIYNDRNEEIGEISEVLIDRDGSVKAVVISVGGFLGMGERNVAVPFERLQWQVGAENTAANRMGTAAPSGTAPTAGTQTGAANTTTSAARTGAMTGTANNTGAATTGAATTAGSTTGAASTTGAGTAGTTTTTTDRNAVQDRDAPRRAILANGTKAELENAPEFKYAD